VKKGLLEAAEISKLASMCFVFDSYIEILNDARRLLYNVLEGEQLEKGLGHLGLLTRHHVVDTIDLRGKLAEHVIEKERYTL
jgi:hypothetical protein